jgi:hypothetical protein
MHETKATSSPITFNSGFIFFAFTSASSNELAIILPPSKILTLLSEVVTFISVR